MEKEYPYNLGVCASVWLCVQYCCEGGSVQEEKEKVRKKERKNNLAIFLQTCHFVLCSECIGFGCRHEDVGLCRSVLAPPIILDYLCSSIQINQLS